MICRILTGVPGSGKTRALLSEAATTPGRHLIAVPRTDLIDEFAADLHALAMAIHYTPRVIPIHSAQAGTSIGVARRLSDALRQTEDGGHVIVLVTHEAFLGLDPARLKGIHVRIDEVPDCAILSGQFVGSTASHALEARYHLEPLGDGLPWSCVRPRHGIDPITPAVYNAEVQEYAAFYKAVSNVCRDVLVDLASWDEARATRRRVHWWSVWTPMLLQGAASVTIAGAGISRSLLNHVCTTMYADDLIFERVDFPRAFPRARPYVTISYFTGHRGSTEWWRSEVGSRCLVQISRYLERYGFSGYWASNDAIKPYFVHRFEEGTACAPRMAGTNALRHNTRCCLIYSNKAQGADSALLDALDLDRDAITQAREYEDIIQFVMRGALRDPSYEGEYNIYLYSCDQAEALRDYLVESGITDRVDVVPVTEVGLMDVRRPGTSAVVTPRYGEIPTMTAEAQRERRRARDRERARDRRAAERAQRRAEGTYRPRGRPRSAAPFRR